MGIKEFKAVLTGNATNNVILDVRDPEETSGGTFANAINIPLDELEKRIAERPKDKELLAHCSTGARAEMAVQSLKKAGLQARLLVANVECEDGECEIEEQIGYTTRLVMPNSAWAGVNPVRAEL